MMIRYLGPWDTELLPCFEGFRVQCGSFPAFGFIGLLGAIKRFIGTLNPKP